MDVAKIKEPFMLNKDKITPVDLLTKNRGRDTSQKLSAALLGVSLISASFGVAQGEEVLGKSVRPSPEPAPKSQGGQFDTFNANFGTESVSLVRPALSQVRKSREVGISYFIDELDRIARYQGAVTDYATGADVPVHLRKENVAQLKKIFAKVIAASTASPTNLPTEARLDRTVLDSYAAQGITYILATYGQVPSAHLRTPERARDIDSENTRVEKTLNTIRAESIKYLAQVWVSELNRSGDKKSFVGLLNEYDLSLLRHAVVDTDIGIMTGIMATEISLDPRRPLNNSPHSPLGISFSSITDLPQQFGRYDSGVVISSDTSTRRR